jgi:hypothetical protein
MMIIILNKFQNLSTIADGTNKIPHNNDKKKKLIY